VFRYSAEPRFGGFGAFPPHLHCTLIRYPRIRALQFLYHRPQGFDPLHRAEVMILPAALPMGCAALRLKSAFLQSAHFRPQGFEFGIFGGRFGYQFLAMNLALAQNPEFALQFAHTNLRFYELALDGRLNLLLGFARFVTPQIHCSFHFLDFANLPVPHLSVSLSANLRRRFSMRELIAPSTKNSVTAPAYIACNFQVTPSLLPGALEGWATDGMHTLRSRTICRGRSIATAYHRRPNTPHSSHLAHPAFRPCHKRPLLWS